MNASVIIMPLDQLEGLEEAGMLYSLRLYNSDPKGKRAG